MTDSEAKAKPLGFYDHHRQSYHDAVPLQGHSVVAEFVVGDFGPDDVDGIGELGAFKLTLHLFGTQSSRKLPVLLGVFGDGIAAARLVLDRADHAGIQLLEEVESREAFNERLLAIGLTDCSDTPLVNVEMTGRHAFAEYAEAVCCRTDQIVSVLQRDGAHIVMYSPAMPEQPDLDNPDHTKVFSVTLRRNHDGMLRFDGEPTEVPGLWEHLRKRMETVR